MFVKLAMDSEGHVKVTEDGKPLYLNDKDEEVPADAPAMYKKIIDLGAEAKKHRERAESISQQYSVLEDIEDLEDWVSKAKKAIEQVENFNDKDWMDVKKVDSLKEQMKEAHQKEVRTLKSQMESQIGEASEKIAKKEEQIRKLMVSNKFSNSPLFAGSKPKTLMSADAAEALFGHHFKVEEDNNGNPVVRAYFASGDAILSSTPERVGEIATFDEAIEIIFDSYPNRDQYLPSSGPGTGAKGGGGGGGGEDKDDLAALQQAYTEAQKSRNTAKMISIKNKMQELRNKQRGGRAA